MARMKEFQPLYNAFRMFQERCLLQDRSLLWPDQTIWTLANLQRWKTQVIDHPNIEGEMNFNEKLEQQLAGAPPLLWGMAADLHYIYYLPSSNITLPTRLRNIGWAAQQGGLTLPSEQDPIWAPFSQGFTRTTIKYHFRYAQFHLLVVFALQLKEKGDARKILADRASVMVGDASRLVAKVSGPFDLIFQDGDRQLYGPLLDRLIALTTGGETERKASHD